MLKKSYLVLSLFLFVSLCSAVTISLKDGSELVGEITAKDNNNYYIDTNQSQMIVQIRDVKRITDGSEDLTAKYYAMTAFSNPGRTYLPDADLNASLTGLSYYESQMLLQYERLNKNTAKISSTMWSIWGITIGISLISFLIINSAN